MATIDLSREYFTLPPTYAEDIELVERTYAGIQSRSFTPGPIVARNEPPMYSFVTAYWQVMGYPSDRELTDNTLKQRNHT